MSAIMGEAVHQSLVNANLLGFGDKYIASLLEAQEKLNGVKIVPRVIGRGGGASRSCASSFSAARGSSGGHAVETALARGHSVTIFTRGRGQSLGQCRDCARRRPRPREVAPGLDALRDGDWDAVIDTSGYVPRVVRASAELLEGRAQRYLFVSSISVYADGGGAGRDESAATATLDDPATEEIMKHYGPLKAACEDGSRAGRSATPRSSCARGSSSGRTMRPTASATGWRGSAIRRCSGDRAALRRRSRAAQTRRCSSSTSRDLGAWMIELVEANASGTFNACSPAGQWTWQSLVDALRGRADMRRPQRGSTRRCLTRAQGGTVDRIAAVDSVDVRRRGGLHGVRLPPCRGGRIARASARRDDRCDGRMACRARQQRGVEGVLTAEHEREILASPGGEPSVR